MIGIYKIVNPKGAVYIGQSWNIDDRKKYYAKLRCKNQNKLYNSIQKYGWEAHSFYVIVVLPKDVSQSTLDQYETLYWLAYKDLGRQMLNLREPGSRGKHSEITKKKMSESKKKAFSSNPNAFTVFRESTIGKKRTQEVTDKINASRAKSLDTKPYRKGTDHWNYGKVSPKKGIKVPTEIVEKARNGMKHLMKPIAMYTLDGVFIMEFDSIKAAARYLDTYDSHILQHLKGKSSRVYGYRFKLI